MGLKIIVVVVATMTLIPGADVGQAQRRPRNRQPVARPTPQPATTQTATAEDGSTVSLKSNGTWEYHTPAVATTPRPQATHDGAQTAITKDWNTVLLETDGTWRYYLAPPIAPPRPRAEREGTLSLEAGPLFRSEDMKPIGHSTFYLLDKYSGQILKEAGVKPDDRGDGLDYDDVVNLKFALGRAMAYPTLPGQQEFLTAAMAAIKPHIVQTATADFVGEARFAAVPVGSYDLMGSAQTPKGMIFWNISVDVKAGQNSIAIDKQYSVYGRLPSAP